MNGNDALITDQQRAQIYREMAEADVILSPDWLRRKADELDGEDRPWLDSLPTDPPNIKGTHFDVAMYYLLHALIQERVGSMHDILVHSQQAGAEIVAWRRSLPKQGASQMGSIDQADDRMLLRDATHNLLYADRAFEPGDFLRNTEVLLAELWRRHSQ